MKRLVSLVLSTALLSGFAMAKSTTSKSLKDKVSTKVEKKLKKSKKSAKHTLKKHKKSAKKASKQKRDVSQIKREKIAKLKAKENVIEKRIACIQKAATSKDIKSCEKRYPLIKRSKKSKK